MAHVQSFYVFQNINCCLMIMPNDEFVSKAICSETMEPLRKDMETVLKALVGEDLRGGIVKDVGDIKASLRTTQASRWGKKELSLVLTAIISALASVVVAVIALLH